MRVQCYSFVTSSANNYQLYDISGNVWEWVSDWYTPNYYQTLRSKVSFNPKGPNNGFDPEEPTVPKRFVEGGHLCVMNLIVRAIGYRLE